MAHTEDSNGEMVCYECGGLLEIQPDLMGDDYVPVCQNVDCALFGETQLPLDDDQRSFGPKQQAR